MRVSRRSGKTPNEATMSLICIGIAANLLLWGVALWRNEGALTRLLRRHFIREHDSY